MYPIAACVSFVTHVIFSQLYSMLEADLALEVHQENEGELGL